MEQKRKLFIGIAVVVVLALAVFFVYRSRKSPQAEGGDVVIERYEERTTVTDAADIQTIKDILLQADYNSDPCDGIVLCTITLDGKEYAVKEDCMGVESEAQQAAFSEEEWKKLKEVLDKYVSAYGD